MPSPISARINRASAWGVRRPAAQFLERQRAVGECVGHPQFGRYCDALCLPRSEDHVHHRHGERHAALMNTVEDVAGAFQDADDLAGGIFCAVTARL